VAPLKASKPRSVRARYELAEFMVRQLRCQLPGCTPYIPATSRTSASTTSELKCVSASFRAARLCPT
jgi:hypothetical protein